ncbi:uncharacterized protein FTOL_10282 [Fusarium torulosum]|uniref:BTB domain-containing protein n=1 Tax=Fusarium torulosum TaxID=33205 RepID=A0AAE8MHI6_9HYPO|nr:uncharacterized protein FTOL_10282 [Fusarium torulosum]
MENPADTKPNPVIEIAPDGDLILMVGPEETKLRIRSILLMAASKVFSTMLGPDWKEGGDIRHHDGPFELPLPEDNAAALQVVCSIIHYQNDKIPRTLPAGDILAVAVVADKYDCVDVVKFASESWLRTSGHEPDDLMLLTAAAYILRSSTAFNNITRTLILNYDGPFLALCTNEIESIMPWKVFCLLEEQRGFARLEVSQILIEGGGASSCCHNCGWTSKYAYAYMKLLDLKDLWPADLFRTSIAKALAKAERMPDPVPEERSTECRYAYKHEPPAYRENRHWKLDSLNERIGLCLRCTRLDRTDSNCSNPSHNR